MVSQENLNKMYEMLIEGEELTTSKLKICGFNSNDITKLVSNKVIERTKRGHYTFLDAEHMHQYGKHLITQKNYDEAKNCFEKCYELDPKHFGNCFSLFIQAINDKDYKSAFKYFEGFYKKDDYYYFSKRDSNFYLFLLNLITTIPEKYKGYVEQLELEDILVCEKDKCKQNIQLYNELRTFAFNQRFKQALKTQEKLTEINGKTYSYDVVTINLLNDLKSDNFKLDIEEQFISCYKSLGERNFEKSRLYLDIVSTLNKLYSRNIKLSGLEKAICICEKNNNLSTIDTPNEKNYYGVKKMPKIFKLIESGTTFENVCKFINLHLDEKNIASLLLAKEYYTNELYNVGDSYLNSVSNQIIESDLVFALLHIVRANKYKYSENKDEEHKNFVHN